MSRPTLYVIRCRLCDALEGTPAAEALCIDPCGPFQDDLGHDWSEMDEWAPVPLDDDALIEEVAAAMVNAQPRTVGWDNVEERHKPRWREVAAIAVNAVRARSAPTKEVSDGA